MAQSTMLLTVSGSAVKAAILLLISMSFPRIGISDRFPSDGSCRELRVRNGTDSSGHRLPYWKKDKQNVINGHKMMVSVNLMRSMQMGHIDIGVAPCAVQILPAAWLQRKELGNLCLKSETSGVFLRPLRFHQSPQWGS